MLREAFYLANVGWPLNKELWISLSGKTPEQEQLHAFLILQRATPCSLRHLSRTLIRKHLLKFTSNREIITSIDRLPLPTLLKTFIALRDKDYSDSSDILGVAFPLNSILS